MYSTAEMKLLVRATLRIYAAALVAAYRGFVGNWRMPFVHFAFLIVVALALNVLFILGTVAGGFALGLLLALLLASYLATVAPAVEGSTMAYPELWPATKELFVPVIGVLFALFILGMVADMALATPEVYWLRATLNLLIAILFNPLPEILYQRPGGIGYTFSESFEFIKENFIEWFLPMIFLISPVLFVSKSGFLTLILFFSTTNPLRMVETFMVSFGNLSVLLSSSVLTFLFLLLVYFVFIFRGALFRELASSTRRKRIYRERMG